MINTHASNLRDEVASATCSVDSLGEVIVNLHVLDRDPALESVEPLASFPQRIKLRADGKAGPYLLASSKKLSTV